MGCSIERRGFIVGRRPDLPGACCAGRSTLGMWSQYLPGGWAAQAWLPSSASGGGSAGRNPSSAWGLEPYRRDPGGPGLPHPRGTWLRRRPFHNVNTIMDPGQFTIDSERSEGRISRSRSLDRIGALPRQLKHGSACGSPAWPGAACSGWEQSRWKASWPAPGRGAASPLLSSSYWHFQPPAHGSGVREKVEVCISILFNFKFFHISRY